MSTMVAVQPATNETLWQVQVETPPDPAGEKLRKRFAPLMPSLSYCAAKDIVLLTHNRSISGAWWGGNGEVVWEKNIPCRNPTSNWSGPEPPIVLDDVFITHAGEVYDISTGDRHDERLWIGMNTRYNTGGMRGCGRALGSHHIVTLRDSHAAYFDLTTGAETFFTNIRSGCANGLLPAGGILNGANTAHGCACNWPIFTSFALVHMPQAKKWRQQAEAGLIKQDDWG